MDSSNSRSKTQYALNKNKYLLPPERDKLLKTLESYYLKDTRNCLALEMALRTGARAQELLNVRIEDLNTYDQTVFLRGLKGSNDREIPLPAVYFKSIQIYTEKIKTQLKEDPRLFPITYDRLYQIWLYYRPVNKKFHSLRHTFAIELYQKTKDLRLVQVALGHRNITNTMIYADYVYSQEELKKLIL